ncbi:MAG: hypothetical protein H5U30_03865 [Marinobacter sp.]|nr:hypothetical protein [Marinobacter sp.]
MSLQIQSQRALFAAESGAQVGVREVLEASSCSAISSQIMFSTSGLTGCRAALSCESVTESIGGPGGDTVYSIVSQGRCGAGADQANRVIEVRVR